MENKIIGKIEYLLELACQFEATTMLSSMNVLGKNVKTTKHDVELYSELEGSAKSLVIKLYGENHPYYKKLEEKLVKLGGVRETVGVLKAIKKEVEDGFIFSTRDLLSAEIFTDFIEMAEHLLKEGYKDAAAVIVGSVLEERLRQLTTANGLDILDSRGNLKKASALNDELYKEDIYNKLNQKQIVAWLDLRNQAAHGHYDEYDLKQVKPMLDGVSHFINLTEL